jgi:fatty acid desaturase
MKTNMGTTDRVIRLLIALAIITLYVLGYLSGIWAIVLFVLSGIFLLTGIAGVCPLYLPFGIRTNHPKIKSTPKY